MNQLKTNLHSINPNPIDTSIKNQQENLHSKANSQKIIPKTIGSAYNKSLVPFSAYAIKGLMIIAWPFVVMSENVSKLLNNNDSNGETKASREELLAMAEHMSQMALGTVPAR